MAMKQKVRKPKKVKTSTKKGVIKKISSRPKKKGADMSDLVGTIQLAIDPMVFQRQIRDEW